MEQVIPNNQIWVCAYLFYDRPWKDFFVDSIVPFVRQVKKLNLTTGFFFIKYWENGPHIRLRFKVAWKDQALLEEMILRHFEACFKKSFPTLITDDSSFLAPKDRIVFTEYEPETERYGGTKAMIVGEKHFEVSSNVVLSILSETSEWNYETALGFGIQLHLSFTRAVGFSLEESVIFFTALHNNWARAAEQVLKTSSNNTDGNASSLNAFKESFQAQRASIISNVRSLWSALNETEDFELEWLNAWISENRKINMDLRKLYFDGEIKSSTQQHFPELLRLPVEKRTLGSIYVSYFHMTNNRLGIYNHDEGYLAYIIKESLQQCE